MKSYFFKKVNPKTRAEYVAGNVSEADTIFSIPDKVLEEIADKVIKELSYFFDSALSQETEIRNLVESKESYTLALYNRDINRFQIIGFKDSIALARVSELGNDEARDHLICAHLKWAFRVACRFHKSLMVDLLDLVQQANLGLVDAVDKWEKARVRGADFKTYASHRVTGEILDFLRGDGKLIGQAPRSIKDLKKKIEWIFEHWTKGETPTPVELAKLCGVSRALIISAMTFEEVPMDDEIFSNTDSGEDVENSVLTYIEAESRLKSVRLAIDKFSARHTDGYEDTYREILFLRLGFIGDGEKMKKIGEKFDLTESRICQIMTGFFNYLESKNIEETTESVLAMQEIVASYEATV